MDRYTKTIEPQVQYRASTEGIDDLRPLRVAPANVAPVGDGSTNYGKIAAGTALGKDSNGLGHPVGLVALDGAVAAAAECPVGMGSPSKTFFPGDFADIVAAEGHANVIAVGDDPSDITLVLLPGAPEGLRLVVAVTGTSTPQTLTFDENTGDITFGAATDGGGAATSTVQDLADALFAQFAAWFDIDNLTIETPADLVQAVAATALVVPYQVISTGQKVLSVDDVAESVTLDGNVTAPVGALLVKKHCYQPSGFLNFAINTVKNIDGDEVQRTHQVDIGIRGDLRSDKVTGVTNASAPLYHGGRVLDPVTGVKDQIDCGPFRFLDV